MKAGFGKQDPFDGQTSDRAELHTDCLRCTVSLSMWSALKGPSRALCMIGMWLTCGCYGQWETTTSAKVKQTKINISHVQCYEKHKAVTKVLHIEIRFANLKLEN